MRTLFSLLLVLAATPALAQSGIVVTDGWFRTLPNGAPAAGYFTVRNTRLQPVAIIRVEANDCGSLMLHRSVSRGGMTGMDMVGQVMIPASGEIKFAPGGFHLMCEKAKLKIGDREAVSFALSDGSEVVVAFQVRNATGK